MGQKPNFLRAAKTKLWSSESKAFSISVENIIVHVHPPCQQNLESLIDYPMSTLYISLLIMKNKLIGNFLRAAKTKVWSSESKAFSISVEI